jgi:hypothetical protein
MVYLGSLALPVPNLINWIWLQSISKPAIGSLSVPNVKLLWLFSCGCPDSDRQVFCMVLSHCAPDVVEYKE